MIGALRDAAWLDGPRARAWLRTYVAVVLVVTAGWLLLSRGGVDPAGKPLGADFLAFWTAGRLAAEGRAAGAYDPMILGPLQEAAFPGVDAGYAPFPYPPVFLLACAVLGALPYFAALAAWLAATGYAGWRVVRAWLGEARGLALPALAYPAVLINAAHGQTAFLTTALFGAGALALPRRPWLAGLCFGALVFKPHLGLLIPVVLLAARRWRAIAGAVISAAALAGAATLAFGLEAWRGFLAGLPLMRAVAEDGRLPPEKLQSLFAALRVWDAPLPAAYAAQAALALAAAAALAWLAWRRPNDRSLGAALAAGTLLASPYLLDYDLVLAAVPLAWLYGEGRRTGFLPWEKLVLLLAFVLPLVSRVLAMKLMLPLAPVVLAALFVLVLRRAAAHP